MITLLQRVSTAQVDVAGECVARIGQGILVFVGVQPGDDQKTASHFVSRLLNYRVFADSEGKSNLSLVEINGGLLLVPQFTLAATTKKGRRPSFTSAAPPELGQQVFQAMVDIACARYSDVESGCFGADMQVQLVNDGPITYILD